MTSRTHSFLDTKDQTHQICTAFPLPESIFLDAVSRARAAILPPGEHRPLASMVRRKETKMWILGQLASSALHPSKLPVLRDKYPTLARQLTGGMKEILTNSDTRLKACGDAWGESQVSVHLS